MLNGTSGCRRLKFAEIANIARWRYPHARGPRLAAEVLEAVEGGSREEDGRAAADPAPGAAERPGDESETR